MKLGTKEIPALRLGAAAVLKAYLGGSQVWPLGFDPASLFAQDEQGVWYDPSDFSTMFQDSAGTTPVTAVEQPVGLMLDNSGGGNHASQPTATSRPVLSARVNLLTKTEQFDDAVWVKSNVTVTANAAVAPDGTNTADLLRPIATSASGTIAAQLQTISGAQGRYTASYRIKPSGFNWAIVAIRNAAGNRYVWQWFDLANGTVGSSRINLFTYVVANIAPDAQGFYVCTLTAITDVADSGLSSFAGMSDADNNLTATVSGSNGIYIWGADLRVANTGAGLPAYQRVNTATDYDTVGFPHYLRFDGVDDWLVTPTITPGVDKAQVFAGVRKLSDAAQGVVAELSATIASNNGTFLLAAPNGATQTYGWDSKGTTQVDAVATSIAAPITSVVTGLADISGDSAIIRVNGAVADTEAGDQGTGNYLDYPIYIGRRGGTTLPFNGHLYGLLVRFGANLPVETIEKTEAWINGKTGAY